MTQYHEREEAPKPKASGEAEPAAPEEARKPESPRQEPEAPSLKRGLEAGRRRLSDWQRDLSMKVKAFETAQKKLLEDAPQTMGIEELHAGMEATRRRLEHTTAQMSAKLRQMLSEEIEAYKRREKTRGAEIMAVFARHNFYANGFTPIELRTTLEDMGPTYVKIGQIMSSRVDLLPERYCRELEKLRQNVKPLDAEIARAVIEQETGKSIDEIYSEFRDEPLGSASIGQAHYGVLKDGTRVVTKVQRPLIAEMMRKDFVLLRKLARLLGTVTDTGEDGDAMVDLVSVIEELEKVTEDELDFRVEAENTRFFREHCIEDEKVVSCPRVIDALTTERIFTMTYVDGYSISKKDRLIDEGYDPAAIGTAIIKNYVHQVLDVGTFHADPHQGNIMVSQGVPCWIDFGMIGRVTEGDISIIQSLILAMLERDVDSMTNAVMSLGVVSAKTSRNRLMEDLEIFLDRYMNVTSVSDLDMAVLMTEVTDLATRNHIALPGKYTMLVRSITTIEGVIEQLCPEVNLFEIMSEKLMERARQSFDLSRSLLSAGKDALSLGRKAARMPGLTFDALNNMVKGRMKLNMELTGYEPLSDSAGETVKNVVLAAFACVLFRGSCALCAADIQPRTPNGVPLIAAVGLVFSVGLAIHTVRKMSKKKK